MGKEIKPVTEDKTRNLQVLQFVFTVVTALATGLWGYFIHAAQERNNEAQIDIKRQQIKLQELQNNWQKEFQQLQNIAQQKQLDWQTEFQKTQLQSQEQIAKNISKLNAITAMNPFIDKIADASPAKARMAAYGLYLLNQETPEMAVTLITATKKPEMDEVLETLGKLDRRIIQYVGKFVTPRGLNDEAGGDKEQKRLDKVIQNIQTARRGYCFFGRYLDGRWDSKSMVKAPGGLPKSGDIYVVHRKTYLRGSFPLESHGELVLGKALGVNDVGTKIKILNVRHYADGAVWCELETTRSN